jgi:hypothetical protein
MVRSVWFSVPFRCERLPQEPSGSASLLQPCRPGSLFPKVPESDPRTSKQREKKSGGYHHPASRWISSRGGLADDLLADDPSSTKISHRHAAAGRANFVTHPANRPERPEPTSSTARYQSGWAGWSFGAPNAALSQPWKRETQSPATAGTNRTVLAFGVRYFCPSLVAKFLAA